MKILIADDHALFRDGLALQLREIIPDVILLNAATFAQALQILDKQPDVDMVVIDLDMPDMKWEEGFAKIKEKSPHGTFVVISASEDIHDIKKSFEMGIKGYIPKRLEPKTMYNALKLVIDGGAYIPPAMLKLDNKEVKNAVPLRGEKTLTHRQSQVLDLIAEGKSNKQIAYEMGVSEATVKLHINALLRCLHVNNRTQAVVTAQKMGLI